MSSYEEAEVLKNGGVVIRYYHGKTILIPADVMKDKGITITCLNQTSRKDEIKERIKLRPREFEDGSF